MCLHVCACMCLNGRYMCACVYMYAFVQVCMHACDVGIWCPIFSLESYLSFLAHKKLRYNIELKSLILAVILFFLGYTYVCVYIYACVCLVLYICVCLNLCMHVNVCM